MVSEDSCATGLPTWLAAPARTRLAPGWEEWVRDALIEGAEIADLLDADYKTTKLEIVEILMRIAGGEAVGDDDLRLVEAATDLSSSALHEALGRSVDDPDEDEDEHASAEQLGDDAQADRRFLSPPSWVPRPSGRSCLRRRCNGLALSS